MTALYLYDDARARTFEPFALTRPLSELRSGAELIRRRWELALGARAAGAIVAAHLERFEELDAPSAVHGELPRGVILANARCAPALEAVDVSADAWRCGDAIAAVRLTRAIPASELADGALPLERLADPRGRESPVRGWWLDEVWSVIAHLLPQLADDIELIAPRLERVEPSNAIIVGTNAVVVERGATIEPSVCFDVSAGPVLVRRGSMVRAFTRLVGPCVIGPDASVLGDRVSGCSIGEMSMVRGEMSETIVLGHANKAHDGFVGHSYLGRWVNLGAGTITSNLKNTYGSVQLWTPDGLRDTGMSKLGALLGDHVKTGIGTRLTTGCVIGAGSNVYGAAVTPKHVPPFSWGDGERPAAYRLDKFLEIAGRAMARRHVTLGARARDQLAAAYARTHGDGR